MLAQERGGLRVAGATLASLTFPVGLYVNGRPIPPRDAWIITLAYPSREPLFCVGGVRIGSGGSVSTTTTAPATGCGMWVSKDIVALDALSGSVDLLIQTN